MLSEEDTQLESTAGANNDRARKALHMHQLSAVIPLHSPHRYHASIMLTTVIILLISVTINYLAHWKYAKRSLVAKVLHIQFQL